MSAVTSDRPGQFAEPRQGLTRTLARHAATLEFDALPSALVEMLKQCVLDTLGVAIGASTLAPEAAVLAEYVNDLGGKPEATLLGFVAGAATAGRLLGLDDEQMENALGIGFNQMSGSRQMAVGAATHMRSMQAGFSGQGAVLAAELARRGIIGSKEIVEGRYGFFRTYIRGREPDWDGIVSGLGAEFPLLEKHGFKVWPACAYTRTTNASTLALRQQHGLNPEDIASITIVGGTGGTQLLCEPIEKKRRPKVSIDGKYSIPFTTAVMAAKGDVTLRDYTQEGLNDPAVLAMADRVSYRPAGQALTGKGGSADVSRTSVEIVTRDGRRLEHRATGVPGDPKNPVSWERLEAKFRDCVSFAARPIAAWKVERAVEAIRQLETMADATEVARLLS